MIDRLSSRASSSWSCANSLDERTQIKSDLMFEGIALTSIGEATFALNGWLKTASIRSTVEVRVAMRVKSIPDMVQTA
jgi:hypothetical protein